MKRIIILLLVLFVGLWLGTNFVRDRPLLSNPFADSKGIQKLKTDTREMAEHAEDKIKDLGTPGR